MIPAISLCSGVGFMDQAFFAEGFSIRAQVEIDPWRREVLALRFPRAQRFEDIHHVGRHNLPANPAIIFGGFPCQPVSGAGQRKGQADERWIWDEFARIVGELRPRVVFLENADEICTPIKVDGVIVAPAPGLAVIASLTALGYDCRWGIVSAASAGAPHQRDRWWCVAWRISNADSDECQTGTCLDEQRGLAAPDYANRDATHADSKRQQVTCIGYGTRNQERDHQAPELKGSAEFHATEPGDPGAAGEALGFPCCQRLPRSVPLTVESGAEVTTNISAGVAKRHTTGAGLEGQASGKLEISAQSQQGFGREQIRSAHESNLGRVVFDGIFSRLERQARTQLYAAPLGLQPYPFEPVRLTDDNYDWKARVEAIGDGVVVSVVRTFAAGIREGLQLQDAAQKQRIGAKE